MEYILIGGLLGLCSAIWVWRQYIKTLRETRFQAPLSEADLKLGFIRDVCDGNLDRAKALLSEKQEMNAILSYEQAIDQVYADMLELTADERSAGSPKSWMAG